jgi:hypothetical protein
MAGRLTAVSRGEDHASLIHCLPQGAGEIADLQPTALIPHVK